MAEFKNKNTDEVIGAEDGSMLARRFARHPDWEQTDAGSPEGDGEVAVSKMSRDQLEARATELGIDLDAVEGTGSTGNVVNADLVKVIEEHTEAGRGADAKDQPTG